MTPDIKALVATIDALEAKATPGPWAWDQRGEKINEWGLGVAFDANDNPLAGRFDDEDAVYVEQVCQTEGATVNYADADLICALRNAWPDLKAATARAEASERDAARYQRVKKLVWKNEASDRYPGYHWQLGLYDDNRLGFDAALDAAGKEKP